MWQNPLTELKLNLKSVASIRIMMCLIKTDFCGLFIRLIIHFIANFLSIGKSI